MQYWELGRSDAPFTSNGMGFQVQHSFRRAITVIVRSRIEESY